MEQYIAQQILKVRDALVNKDCDEAYHQLYAIASKGFDKWEPWEEIEKAATQPPSAPEEIISKAKQLFSRISKYSQPGTIDHLATIRRLSQQGIDLFEQPTPAPAVNWDQVKINFDAGMSELEASFQAGYSAGVDMAVKRAASAPDVEISKTIDRLKECISRHMDPYNLGDEGETTKLINQLIKYVQATSTTQGAYVILKEAYEEHILDKEKLLVKYPQLKDKIEYAVKPWVTKAKALIEEGVLEPIAQGAASIELLEKMLEVTKENLQEIIAENMELKQRLKQGAPWVRASVDNIPRNELIIIRKIGDKKTTRPYSVTDFSFLKCQNGRLSIENSFDSDITELEYLDETGSQRQTGTGMGEPGREFY